MIKSKRKKCEKNKRWRWARETTTTTQPEPENLKHKIQIMWKKSSTKKFNELIRQAVRGNKPYAYSHMLKTWQQQQHRLVNMLRWDNGMGRTKWLSALNLINWLNWWRIQSRETSAGQESSLWFSESAGESHDASLTSHRSETRAIICIVCVHGHATAERREKFSHRV